MNARQVNTMLWAGAGVLTLGAVVSILAAVFSPLESEDHADSGRGAAASRPANAAALPSVAELERVWGVSLRQNLGDALPVQPTPVAVVPTTAAAGAGLPVSLVGTIGTSLAMLKTTANAVEVCGVGDSVNGVTVVAVRPAEVDVRFNGRVMTLAKPKEN